MPAVRAPKLVREGKGEVVRILGIVLVALGALGLGWQGLSSWSAERPGGPGGTAVEQFRTVTVPPVVSGIAVVSGLILLASHGRREES